MNHKFELLDMIIRSSVTFTVLLVMTRLMGKKQLSHLTFFNYVTGITIGSIAANISSESGNNMLNGLIGLITWTLLTILVSYIGMKSAKARVVIDGQPTIVIKKGKIDQNALAKTRLNLDDLSMMLRERDTFSITEVDYAILEPHGKLSVLKKQEYQTATKKDTDAVKAPAAYLPSEIISSGHFVERNLKELGVSRTWVLRQLEKEGIKSVADVFYAELQSDGSLYIARQDTSQ